MPNMCNNYDNKWRNIKYHFANKWGELTLLWYCGILNRKKAFNNNIYSWKINEKKISPTDIVNSMYNSETTSYNTSKRKNIIKSMIELNTSDDSVYTSRNFGDIIDPYHSSDNSLEIFIDFEVLSGYKNETNKNTGFIYLIGMYWKCPETDTLLFNSFYSEDLTLLSEKRMINNWWKKVKSIKKQKDNIILYHWSSAEYNFLKKAFKRNKLYHIKSDLTSGEYELRDLMEMYIDDEVVIKNVWNYSLKSIARGLFNLGLIPEIWNSYNKGGDMISGRNSIYTATKCYNYSKSSNIPIYMNQNFISLINYNKTDCKVLYYLLQFLRKYIYSTDKRTIRKHKRKLVVEKTSINKKLFV